MPRPLFEIAREIASDWSCPAPNAKTYLKGMYYLLGMDDRVADLDATTAVRMFLLYSKEWTGPVAERVKAEMQTMRRTRVPTNSDLLATNQFAAADLSVPCCELCEASLGTPLKHVYAHTHWNSPARMCMHCAFFLSRGIDLGDGALFIATSPNAWRHLHGEATPLPPSMAPAKGDKPKRPKHILARPKLRFRIKRFSGKVVRKCFSIVNDWFRKSA